MDDPNASNESSKNAEANVKSAVLKALPQTIRALHLAALKYNLPAAVVSQAMRQELNRNIG